MAVVHGDSGLYQRDGIFSGIGNALSSIFNPIFPGQTTSQTSTSATLTLTDSPTATQTSTDTQSPTSVATQTLTSQTKSTATSTTSSSTASASSSTAASSATTSSSASTSAGTSSTSASANNPTSTSSPSLTTSVGPSGTVTLTETASASSASTTAASNAAASKGFLANKGLSVGVITACSLVGLVLLIIVATYTIRRRRRNKLHEEAIDFSPFPSSDELLGKHGDIERGGGGGAMGESLTRPSSRGSANDNAFASAAPEMYQTGYAVPTYMPPSGPAAPPKATITSTTNQVAFPSQMYTNTGYNDYGPYPTYAAPINPNPNAYQPQPAANTLAPRPGPSYNTAYGAAIAAAGPAPANPPVRKASQRKQVPPLNLSAARPDASPPAYQVTNDAGASPMMNPYGATPNPVDPPLSAVSPVARRASASLLNSPVGLAYSEEGTSAETGASGGSSTRKRTSSHSRMLDPSLPTLPVAAPLPDKFGAQGAAVVVDEKAPIRQLTVRNE